MTNRLTIELREHLVDLLASETVETAAKRLGVATATAYAWDSRRLRGVCRCGAQMHSGPCADEYVDPEVAVAILRTRLEENATRSDLARRFGVSLEVVSRATEGHPYRGRRSPDTHDWTLEEDATLRRLYPRAPRGEIEAALPRRWWQAIQRHACDMGLKRTKLLPEKQAEIEARLTSAVLCLRNRRLYLGLTLDKVASCVSFSRGLLGQFETGQLRPTRERLLEWMDALGVTMSVEAIEISCSKGKSRNRGIKRTQIIEVVAENDAEPSSPQMEGCGISEPVTSGTVAKAVVPAKKPYGSVFDLVVLHPDPHKHRLRGKVVQIEDIQQVPFGRSLTGSSLNGL